MRWRAGKNDVDIDSIGASLSESPDLWRSTDVTLAVTTSAAAGGNLHRATTNTLKAWAKTHMRGPTLDAYGTFVPWSYLIVKDSIALDTSIGAAQSFRDTPSWPGAESAAFREWSQYTTDHYNIKCKITCDGYRVSDYDVQPLNASLVLRVALARFPPCEDPIGNPATRRAFAEWVQRHGVWSDAGKEGLEWTCMGEGDNGEDYEDYDEDDEYLMTSEMDDDEYGIPFQCPRAGADGVGIVYPPVDVDGIIYSEPLEDSVGAEEIDISEVRFDSYGAFMQAIRDRKFRFEQHWSMLKNARRVSHANTNGGERLHHRDTHMSDDFTVAEMEQALNDEDAVEQRDIDKEIKAQLDAASIAYETKYALEHAVPQ
jgi:hypothetical protein